MKIVWCLGSEFSSDRFFCYLAEILNDTIPIASIYGIFARMYHKNQLYQCLGICIYIYNTWYGYYPVIWRLPYLIIIRIPIKFKHLIWFLPQNNTRKLNGSCFTLFPAHLTWKSHSGFSWSWNKMKNSCAKARPLERDDDWYGSAGVCHEFGWVFFSTWKSVVSSKRGSVNPNYSPVRSPV